MDEIETLRKSAGSGDSDSAFLLGLLYYRGKTIAGDLELAWDWLEKASNGGHKKAPYYIGRICTYYADNGVAMPSQMASMAPSEISRDWNEIANEWYAISAERNYHPAIARLGVNYLGGIGTEKSSEKAYVYFVQARDAGNLAAQGKVIRLLLLFNKGASGFIQAFGEIVRAIYLLFGSSKDESSKCETDFKERFLI